MLYNVRYTVNAAGEDYQVIEAASRREARDVLLAWVRDFYGDDARVAHVAVLPHDPTPCPTCGAPRRSC